MVAACTTAEEPTASSSATPALVIAVPTQAPATSTPSPAQILTAALAPLQAAAEFETTVSVDGAVAVTSIGRSVADASQLTVTSGGQTVDYIHVPPGAWARQPGGSWVQVAADQAAGSPLDVLAAPSSLEVRTDAGAPTTFRATYPSAALGLEGDPVTVDITFDGASVVFIYHAETDGHLTVSATIIRPTTVLDPIVAPAN